MFLAKRGIIPPEQWFHKQDLINNYNETVAILMTINNMNVPEYWYYDKNIKFKNGNNTAIILA